MTKTDHPRRKKTPRQRAEEAVALAERKITRLVKAERAAKATYEALSRELDDARVRLEYVKQDPALKGNSTTTGTTKAGDTA